MVDKLSILYNQSYMTDRSDLSEEAEPEARDFATYLQGNFPGHTMQRVRTPDGRYRYSYVSPGVMETFGLDPDALTSDEGVRHEWVPEPDRQRFVAALDRSAETLEMLDEEVRVLRSDGRPCWVRSIGHPKRLDDGTVIWDGVALDVTDRREALDALERALARARREEVSANRLTAIAAQDVSAPFNRLRAAMARLDRLGGNAVVQDAVGAFEAFAKAFDAARDVAAVGQRKAAVKTEASPVDALSERQREVLRLIKLGQSNREIADALGIREGTVKLHVSAILKALGVKNRTMAVALLPDEG